MLHYFQKRGTPVPVYPRWNETNFLLENNLTDIRNLKNGALLTNNAAYRSTSTIKAASRGIIVFPTNGSLTLDGAMHTSGNFTFDTYLRLTPSATVSNIQIARFTRTGASQTQVFTASFTSLYGGALKMNHGDYGNDSLNITYNNGGYFTHAEAKASWTHLAIVKNGSNVKMFVEGLLGYDRTQGWDFNLDKLILGGTNGHMLMLWRPRLVTYPVWTSTFSLDDIGY